MTIIHEGISKWFIRADFRPLSHASLLGACLSVFVVMLASRLGAQTTTGPIATGTVEGYIRCGDDGSLARLVVVHLYPLVNYLKEGEKKDRGMGREERTYTDFDGYYSFGRVPPGTYLLDVELGGYSKAQELARINAHNFPIAGRKELLSTFPQVTVKAGAQSRLDAVIYRGGAITGRVTFDSGGALSGASVWATMVSTNLFDRYYLNRTGSSTSGDPSYAVMAVSDDRGVYRFAGLPQGKYRISVNLAETLLLDANEIARVGTSDLTVFAPEALTEADAQLIDVNNGDEVTGTDISIPLRMLHSIGGVVTLQGEPLQNASVYIHDKDKELNFGDFPSHAITLADGSYRFDLVPSGTYVVRAEFVPKRKGLPSATREISVTVLDGNMDGVNIDLADK